MKTTLLIFASITALSQAATFAPLNIDSLEISETDTAISTASIVLLDTVRTSYTFIDDYDGLGGDDILSFDVVATYSDTSLGAQVSSASALNYVIEPGESITFSIDNLSYTRAGGLPSAVIFNGFYEISVGGNVTGDFSSVATGESYLGLSGTGVFIAFGDNYPVLDLTLSSQAIGSKVFRRPDASFSLETTVPEPSITMFLGVGGLALVLRRHRKS